MRLSKISARYVYEFLFWANAVCITAMVMSSVALAQSPEVQGQQADATVAEDAEKKELRSKLAKALTGSKWTGQFTIAGRDAPPTPETYEIVSASHEGDDNWLLLAKMSGGGEGPDEAKEEDGSKKESMAIPIPLQILWAGRTPVITVDRLTIPGMGTFDARVLMRQGSYAGTWKHGAKGGHLFGTYTKAGAIGE